MASCTLQHVASRREAVLEEVEQCRLVGHLPDLLELAIAARHEEFAGAGTVRPIEIRVARFVLGYCEILRRCGLLRRLGGIELLLSAGRSGGIV